MDRHNVNPIDIYLLTSSLCQKENLDGFVDTRDGSLAETILYQP